MSNTKKDIKKIVLAYSGGLDTSVIIPGSLTLAIKENRCEASKMAYFFVKFFIFFLSNV